MHTKPRETLFSGRTDELRLPDLISAIIGTGTKQKPVDILSQEISVRLLAGERSPHNLATIDGLGVAKAAALIAALELSRRLADATLEAAVTSPAAVHTMLSDLLEAEQEWFAVLLLNSRQSVTRRIVITVGTVNQTMVHPRDVFRAAIRENATSVIVSHNHPSGLLDPSSEDLRITSQLAAVGNLLGISLQDHVIVTKTEYLSLRLDQPSCFCNTHQ